MSRADHRPAPGVTLRHEGRRVRVFTRPWRDGHDHPTYSGHVWLSIQPFTRQWDSAGHSYVAPAAEKPLWCGWVPPTAVDMRVALVLGPGWTEVKGKGQVAA